MDKVKVMVSGCNGHMGQIVCRLIEESEDMYILCGFDIATKITSFPVFNCIAELEKSKLIPDIIIDFSKPACTMHILEEFATNYHIPMVIATTGYEDENEALCKIEACAEHTMVFFASNMSYSVCVFEQILRHLAPKMLDYDIEIVETHHNRKADAPSGTAKSLAKAINAYLGKPKKTVYGREGKRESNEIGISSLRGGNIVGTHTVKFIGQSDMFELTHTALKRDMFAEGALKAAQYILELKEHGIEHGLFGMKNMM